jgi:hypothetical protein
VFRTMNLFIAIGLLSLVASAQTQPAKTPQPTPPAPPEDWIAISNGYAKLLMDVSFEHHPEAGSQQGLSQYDNKVGQPTLVDENQERQQMEGVLRKLKAAAAEKQPSPVSEDLQIMIDRVQLDFKQEDYARAHEVPYFNASGRVFGGLHILLDEQTPADRRNAAVLRIREYAGLEPGYKPLTEILKQRVIEQMAKPDVIYPAKVELETEMGRNSNYVEGIASLMEKYQLTGWQEPYATLKQQLTDYDAWVKTTILPKARTDFRLPPEEYALDLQSYGIDIPPDQIATMAHQAFIEIQGEMKGIAAQIAKQRNLPSID